MVRFVTIQQGGPESHASVMVTFLDRHTYHVGKPALSREAFWLVRDELDNDAGESGPGEGKTDEQT